MTNGDIQDEIARLLEGEASVLVTFGKQPAPSEAGGQASIVGRKREKSTVDIAGTLLVPEIPARGFRESGGFQPHDFTLSRMMLTPWFSTMGESLTFCLAVDRFPRPVDGATLKGR